LSCGFGWAQVKFSEFYLLPNCDGKYFGKSRKFLMQKRASRPARKLNFKILKFS
jgi:hypothetical protein